MYINYKGELQNNSRCELSHELKVMSTILAFVSPKRNAMCDELAIHRNINN